MNCKARVFQSRTKSYYVKGGVAAYDKIQNRVFVDLQSSKEFDGGEINYSFSILHVAIDNPQDTARVVTDVKVLPGIDRKAFTVEVDNETYENAAATLNELVVTHDRVFVLGAAVRTFLTTLSS